MKIVNCYGKTCLVEKRGSAYVAYSGLKEAILGTVSPNLMSSYSQDDLERAYKEGDLYHK